MNEEINASNAGYAFYKEYLSQTEDGKWNDDKEKKEKTTRAKRLDENLIERMNSQAQNWIKEGVKRTNYILLYPGKTKQLFSNAYTVCYPGLLIGSGYPHMPDEKLKGGIQNGFLFDYTTGAPYIPGSSIKGVIADVFQRAIEGRDNDRVGYKQYISEALNNMKIDDTIIRLIWEKSFHGVKNGSGDNTEFDPVGERDIFFDAFIVGKSERCNGIMGIDNITPHKYVDGNNMELDFDLNHMPLFEPKPITILRIMPGVHFSIQMMLHDVKNDEGNIILTKEKKSELFYRIIEDFGVGAKTNVGYGQLTRVV